jgi:hypothetical protein
MEGFWPVFYLMVILKIPVAALLYLVWWAIKQTDEPTESESGDDHGFRRRRIEPKPPRGPRRGPHAPDARPLPACPPGGRLRVIHRPAPVRATTGHGRGSADPVPR